jgi:hypothetical protein
MRTEKIIKEEYRTAFFVFLRYKEWLVYEDLAAVVIVNTATVILTNPSATSFPLQLPSADTHTVLGAGNLGLFQ